MKYSVKAGDTWSSIAIEHTNNGAVNNIGLAKWNNLTIDKQLKVGQIIDIPDAWLKSKNYLTYILGFIAFTLLVRK